MIKKIYRTDVQGLRSIGICLVVLCHIWFGKVSGGVDVFFVVSAYLMTNSLMGTIAKEGRVKPFAFWGRLILRLMPVACLVIFVTALLGAFIMPETTWRGFALEGLLSLLQLENLQLLRDSTDYLSRDAPASPFQQFWALSNQMQFYAVLPFIIGGVAWLSRAISKERYDLRIHVAITGLIGLASFVFAVWILSLNPAPHYFNPATRMWEFMLGSMCSAVNARTALSERPSFVLGWIGLALVLSCAFVIPTSMPYPGVVALWPTVGAALILISGANGLPRFSAGSLLSINILQRASEISFTVYLWHWPTLVFAQELRGHAHLTPAEGAVVIAVAVLAAILTKAFVEDRLRYIGNHPAIAGRPEWQRLAFPFLFGALLMLPALLTIGIAYRHSGGIARSYVAGFQPRTDFRPLTALDPALPADLKAQLIAVPGFIPALYGTRCNQKPEESRIVVCEFGSKDPRARRLLLFGGSHATQWFPPLGPIAEEQDLRLLTLTKSACTVSGHYSGHDVVSSSIPACRSWAADAVRKILALKPDYVITTATRPRAEGHKPSGPAEYGDLVRDDDRAVWKQFTAAGIGVIALRDNPRLESSVPTCVARFRTHLDQCTMRRTDYLSDPSPLLAERPDPLIRYIDLSDYLCTRDTCPPIANGVLVYYDGSHISMPFVRGLQQALGREIAAAIRSIDAGRGGARS